MVSAGDEVDVVGLGDGADDLADMGAEFLLESRGGLGALPFRVTKAVMASPLISCGRPTTAASATAGVGDEGALDLGGAEAVAGDVEDVVEAADDPEVAVLVRGRRRRRCSSRGSRSSRSSR